MKNLYAYTLIETLMGVLLLSTLLFLAFPSLSKLNAKTRVENEITQLHKLTTLARNQALSNNTHVTLCPLTSNNSCSSNWQLELSVFIDDNQNMQYEPEKGDRMIAKKEAINANDILQYGKSRTGLTFSPSGQLSGWGQNATFNFCPYDYPELSQGLIISSTGRSYQSTYNKKRTAHINRWGKKITCL